MLCLHTTVASSSIHSGKWKHSPKLKPFQKIGRFWKNSSKENKRTKSFNCGVVKPPPPPSKWSAWWFSPHLRVQCESRILFSVDNPDLKRNECIKWPQKIDKILIFSSTNSAGFPSNFSCFDNNYNPQSSFYIRAFRKRGSVYVIMCSMQSVLTME